MKRILLTAVLLLSLSSGAFAQAMKVTAANTGLGALNGALLGLGAMGLSGNSDDLTPLRVGVGFGTLYGLGMGIYDATVHTNNGITNIKYGMLHSSEYSAMIPMFDTVYGGATGAVVGMAISLINGTSIRKGFVNGGSVGLFGGFLFGITDVLYFSQTRTNSLFEPGSSGGNDGFVTLTFGEQSTLSFGKLDYTNAPVLVSGKFQNVVVSVVQLAHYRHQF
jgi:hypothetical protein